ncbi:MAG TPA: hypothetical protein VLW85_24155, partial [Myxococcales bacterium]|nr:hypothetical protein [Myxococcales bacterium]
ADAGAGVKSTSLTVTDANTATLHTVSGTPGAAGDYTFTLDAAYLLANTEGPLSFTFNAQDNLSAGVADASHSKNLADSRSVDGKPPTVTITQIINPNQQTTDTAPQVAYPDAVTNTGYDATHFIYSDTVQIKGTIKDSGAGIAVVSGTPTPNYEIDGTGAGPKFAITSCTNGQTSTCNFITTATLNDPTQAGAFAASDSTMQIVVDSLDEAVDAAGNPAGNSGASSPVQFNVTRFWWKQALTGASTVNGLAVYPSAGATGVGDVIATTSSAAGFDSVFSLYRKGPLHSGGAVAWSKGASFYAPGNDLGSVQTAPVIGAAGTSPTIYIATSGGDVVALNATGNGGSSTPTAAAWNCGTGNLIDPVHNTPAVVQASKVGSLSNCEAVIAGADNSDIWAVCGTAVNSCTPRSTTIAANGSSPVAVLGGNFYVGAGNKVDQTNLSGTGGFAAVNPFTTGDTNAFNYIVTDGSELFAFNNNAQKAYAFDNTLNQRYSKSLSAGVNGAPILLPAAAPTPGLLFNENSKSPTNSVFVLGTAASPAETGVFAASKLPSTTTAPLLGSDNRVYTDGGGVLYALNQTSSLPFTQQWNFSIGAAATFNGPPTMDCQGVLYAASGGTVWAFITDAKGLANSPWPKYQRDARNSGNADASTLWGANVSGTCTQ